MKRVQRNGVRAMIWHIFWNSGDEGRGRFEKNLGLSDSFLNRAASFLVRNTTHSAVLFGFDTRSTGI